jgi:hypothetical protein
MTMRHHYRDILRDRNGYNSPQGYNYIMLYIYIFRILYRDIVGKT